MKKRGQCQWLVFILGLVLLLTACGGQNRAASMHLVRTEGTVHVDNDEGKSVKVAENLGLYSGYELTTKASSYGWITLDDSKLAKMDENSDVEIRKKSKRLELLLRSGGLFFNVTEPLAEDEEMTIRNSTMAVGIRGTCGWVEAGDNDLMCVYLLRGKVECTIYDREGNVLTSETITAGQAAKMERDGDVASITVKKFRAEKAPDFVREEMEGDDSLTGPAEEGEEPTEEVEGSEETERGDTVLVFANYVGTYKLYDNLGYYESGESITLNEDGTISGGHVLSVINPESVTQKEDGSICILFRQNEETESYTIYPPGTQLPSWGAEYDNSNVYIDYLYAGGGVMELIYAADPGTLGSR